VRGHLLWRLLSYIPVLFCVSVLVFFLMRFAPGDAAMAMLEEFGFDLTHETLAEARGRLGLDLPLWRQYGLWIWRVARLDFGKSVITGRDVLPEFLTHLRDTVRLSVPALLLSVLVAFPTGVMSAMYAGGLFDKLSRGMAILFLSIPAFCLGLALILFFGVRLGWLPTFGSGGFRHYILPCATVTAGSSASFARFIRASVSQELSREYIRAARARGVAPRVIVWRGALRNAAPPLIASLGIRLGLMLGGSAVVEKVFSWPGTGKFLIDAIGQRDYTVVQCCAVMYGLFFVTLNLLSDLACMLADPKTRRAGSPR
jgi:peptide/nickel transport system permease protein